MNPTGTDARHWWLSAAGLVLLLIVARLYLGSFAEFSAAHDLQFFDESQYLASGAYAQSVADLRAQWAPPYCLWYRVLFRITGDTVTTYHLSAYLLAFALPLLWFGLCAAMRVAPWWGVGSALAWLISSANLETLRVGVFATCIVLGALCLSRLGRREGVSWWFACAGLWVAAFVRPELAIAAALAVAIGAWRIRSAAWIVAALTPLGIMAALFGLPFGAGRSGVAFQQHLAANILQWNHLPFELWIRFEDVIRRYYELPGSALDFAVQQPLAFLHHLVSNAWRLGTQSLGSALLPASGPLFGVVPIIGVTAGALLQLRPGNQREARGLALTPVSVSLGLCSLLILASCVVIYPREHYLPLLLSAALLLVAPRTGTELRTGVQAVAMLALAGVILLLPSHAENHRGMPRPIEQTVMTLRAVDAAKPMRIFDQLGVVQIYLQRPAQRLGPRDFRPPFAEFVREHDVTAVITSEALARDPLLTADATWQAFRRDPASLGFRCQPVAGTDRAICLRDW